jgi:hypothetical protein
MAHCFSDGAGPTTWHDTFLPKDFSYVGEKIDISPALIIPDCSRAEYVPVDELELTELGKHLVEEEGWKLENEWSDTRNREVKLLDAGYNKKPNDGEAYAMFKSDGENLYGLCIHASEKTERPNTNLLVMIDTKYENNYYPQPHDFVFNIWYDGGGNKKTAFAYGNKRGWPNPLGKTPAEIISTSGLATTQFSKDENDKQLIYKFKIPLGIANPNNLLRERIALAVGITKSDSWLAYPKNEEWGTSYTWADAFYQSQTQAIPEFGSIHVPGIGRIDVKDILFPATVGILTAILLRIKKASPHSHKQPSISSESYSVL